MQRSIASSILAGAIVASGLGCDSKPSAKTPVASQAPLPVSGSIAPKDASPDAGSREGNTGPVEAEAGALVDIRDLLPAIALDMRYAGKNNFVGKVIYAKSRCLLRSEVAKALAKVQQALAKNKMQLLIWDCYRPFTVQEEFWQLVPDSRFVAKPVRLEGKLVQGSKHNRGAAVDLTLASLDGKALTMPTDHDDFTAQARVGATGIPPNASKNAATLRAYMEAAGFTGIASEWWHYDHKSWQQYPLSDEPL